MTELTRVLAEAERGDPQAAARLASIVYEELRAMARQELAGERQDHTLQPTALVHEAYMRLTGGAEVSFENRAHFFGAAALAIRRVLVDHARRRGREKRGGGLQRVELVDLELASTLPDDALLAMDDALHELEERSPTAARIVELRFFAGMTVVEVARALDTSVSTVERTWRVTRAWLRSRVEGDGDEPALG